MNIPEIDLEITEAIQEILSNHTPTMRFLTTIGDPIFYIIMIIVIAWFFDYKTGAKLGILIAFAGLMQGVLKLTFQQPRPYMVSQTISLKAGRAEMGYGFPSGHATVSATVSTYCVYHLKKISVVTIAVLFPFLMGLSRICLGVHSFFQVFAGWILGIAIIIGSYYFETKMAQWHTQLSLSKKLIPIFTFSIILVLILFVFNKDTMSFTDFLWESELSLVFGLFHGLTTGGSLSFKRTNTINIQTPSLKKNLTKLLFLIITATVFIGALNLSEQLNNKIMACLLVYTESFLLGYWVLYLAPKLFNRLSLSNET